jgi:dihydrofolate reductase
MPIVRMIACMSMDGYISRGDGEVPNQIRYGGWTSPEDKEIFKSELVKADILLMGRRTYETMPRSKKQTMVITSSDSRQGVDAAGIVLPDRDAVAHWLDYEGEQGAGLVLLCGGCMTYSSMLQWDLVDEIVLVVEPIIFGKGVPLTSCEDGPLGDVLKFTLKSGSKMNSEGSLCLRYARR